MRKIPSLHRRAFLRGMGGAMVALPRLNIHSAETAAPPMRMVCVGTTFGFVPRLFFPEQTGTDYAMPELLKPLEHHRNNFTVLSHLDHGVNGVGGHQGVHAYLSGILSKNSKGFAEQNVSVDQKAAEWVGTTTRYPSMQFTSGSEPNNLLSWTRAGVAIPPVQDPHVLFSLLFQAPKKGDVEILRRTHIERQSILDLVKEDAQVLQRRVGREDREKLDQYFTSVRSVEKRLTQSEAWLDRPKPVVSYAVPQGAGSMDFAERVPIYYDLMTLALQTDSTRIITLEISDIGRNSGGFPITRGYHQLTHHGKVEDYIQELSIIENFHTSQFARFLDQLAGVTESDGRTLLDHTMALLGSGMGNASSHSNRDLPFLLAGGGFRHGQHLDFAPGKSGGTPPPASNLLLSMLQRFGVETDRFNLATGTLTGLDVA